RWSWPGWERAAFRRSRVERSRCMAADFSRSTPFPPAATEFRRLGPQIAGAGNTRRANLFRAFPRSLLFALMEREQVLDTFAAGTLAGAGCFRCRSCGFAVALHERDEVPACPHCGGEDFRRSSIFGELELREPSGQPAVEAPDWL